MREIILRQYIRALIESTARIQDLTQPDILSVLDDILGREPLLTFTEKLAGQFLEVVVENGQVLANFKDAVEKNLLPSDKFDIAGVAKTIRNSPLALSVNAKFKFEVIKTENRPDYIDYAIGDTPIAIEFTGSMTKQMSDELNHLQNNIKFLSQTDITKRPRQLSPELRQKIQDVRDSVAANPRIAKSEKAAIESMISESLVEIFGESIFGGPPEGIFATGASKPFKIPEKRYAEIQRIQVPIYATFSDKSYYTPDQIKQRIAALASNPSLMQTDKLIADTRKYLEAASMGFDQRGFRTFFNPSEASELLSILDQIGSGNVQLVDTFYTKMKRRVGNKKNWISTGV